MSKKARKGKISKFRTVAGVSLLTVLVIGCALLGRQIHTEKERIRMQQMLQNLYGGSTAQAEALATPTEAPTAEPAPVEETKTTSDTPTEPAQASVQSDVVQIAQAAPAQPTAIPAAPVATVEASDGELVFQEDFAQLYEVNKDLVGWIDVGNHMSMPVVYRDNTFYLDHDYYGKSDKAGTLFINEANTIWPDGDTPADQNLLFHGHNMRDGSIFGDLDDYRNTDYLKDNVIVSFRTIYDPEPTDYVVYALFDCSVEIGASGYFDVGYINFDDDDEFAYYTNGAIGRSFYNMPFDVQRDDKMITLLTCSYSNDNGRFVLFCRALRDGETRESIYEQAKQITHK